jgi:uncharacterized protein YegL
VVLLDTSGSMAGQRIADLNNGLKTLVQDLREDSLARLRSDIAIMTFDDDVKMVQNFSTVDNFEAPTLTAQGQTQIGKAMREALRQLEARKQLYKSNNIPYYRPWLFILTDGEPAGEPPAEVDQAAEELSLAQKEKRVAVFPIGVGEANMETLAKITSPAHPKRLAGTKFKELFEWMSRSLGKRAQSQVGEQITLENPPWEA